MDVPGPALPPHPFRVDVDQQRQAMVVRLHGAAGMTASDDLDRAVRLIKVRRPRRLVVDLAGLTFIASLGLTLLLGLRMAIHHDGGEFRIAGASPSIAGVVKRCRLDRILPLYASVQEAMDAMQGPAEGQAFGASPTASPTPDATPPTTV